ncbi:MAG: phosphoribosylanthranilate isomerase [Bacillaceae bacterium]|nr:phosphoribosylanthranilate isomerase [Bacillaceae bacterium]
MLAKIVETKMEQVRNLVLTDEIEVERYSLLDSLQKHHRQLALIAEVKKASPSKGIITTNFQPLNTAINYQNAGADAISVLTDETFFQGHNIYLTAIKQQVKIPVLRKDFIISEKQIEESRRIGADAILLIATILDKNQLHEYYLQAYEKGMECLVEVHSMADAEKVLLTFKPEIIGINNRNLKTFTTNIQQTIDLQKQLPSDLFVISESGINHAADIKKLEGIAQGILVGEALMRGENQHEEIKKTVWRATMTPLLKYCGNHHFQDVLITSKSRANYLGFIFAKSKRQVQAKQVNKWLEQLMVRQKIVGVFVNSTLEEIEQICREVPLDIIQCHGDETPEEVAKIKQKLKKEVWKVVHHSPQALKQMQTYFKIADGYVIDSKVGNRRGGTGIAFDWDFIPTYQKEAIRQSAKCFIAGGINPNTIQELLPYQPLGIDLSSGIEIDGKKSEEMKNILEERLFHEYL